MFGSRPGKEDGYVRFDKHVTKLKCAHMSFTEVWNDHQIWKEQRFERFLSGA